jgi:hypothetical protein
MKRSTFYLLFAGLILCTAPLLLAAAKVGEPAPAFTATASDGKTYKLADYRGKYVVLEWHNNGCPYVGKQYNSGNMRSSKSSGRAGASPGSRFCLPRRESRDS